MANDKVYIFDEENIRINVYEEGQIDLNIVNDGPIIEVVRICEPGPQGPKGNDGGEYVLPQNVISSSIQISSDISGSFTELSSSFQSRIFVFENKTLISGSNQLTSSFDSRYERTGNNIISSSQQVKNLLPDGSISSSLQLNSVFELKGTGIVSSSNQIANDISGSFTNVSSSIQSRISVFENKTLFSSSQQLPNNLVSGSEQLSQSYDQRYHRLGTNIFSSSQQVQFNQITGIPSGIISSSQGFVLSTETSSFLRNEFSSSSETRFNRLEQQTSSYAQNSALSPVFNFTGSTLTRLGIIEQATSSYVLNPSTQSFAIKSEISGAFVQLSSSLQSRISVFENKTLISGSEQLSGSYDLRYHRLGTGLLSSSGQISNDISGSFISSSNSLSNRIGIFEGKTLFSGSNQVVFQQISNVPIGLISSSQQINTGSFSGSFKGDGSQLTGILSSSYALSASYVPNVTLPSNLLSSSQQVQFSGISGIPTNLVSGSDQISSSYDLKYELKGRNIVSSSQQILNSLPNNLISGSEQLTGSYDLRYERKGNNIVSGSEQVKNLLPNNTISGSEQLTSSYDQRYHRLGTGILSSSIQIANDISGSFYVLSSSLSNRVVTIEQTISNLNVYTSSLSNRLNTIELFSGSINLFTSSIQSEVNNLKTATGSYIGISALLPLNNFSGSVLNRLGAIESTTGSLNTFSGSVNSRLNSLQIFTASYATTGSNIFVGSQTISGSTNITGSLSVIGQISGTFAGNGSGLTNIISSSYALSASYAPGSSLPSGLISSSLQFQTITNPFTGSFTGSFNGNGSQIFGIISSSYALTASYALNGGNSNGGIQTIGIRIETQDNYITEGSKGYRHIPANLNIVKVRGFANVNGNINLNVRRNGNVLGNYSLTNSSSSIDSTLSGWTTSLLENDLIEFYVSQSSLYITEFNFFMDLQG